MKTTRDTGRSEKGAELWVNQTRGYRGKAMGVATIVLHNGGFVESKEGWGQGGVFVSEWVQMGRFGATEVFTGN